MSECVCVTLREGDWVICLLSSKFCWCGPQWQPLPTFTALYLAKLVQSCPPSHRAAHLSIIAAFCPITSILTALSLWSSFCLCLWLDTRAARIPDGHVAQHKTVMKRGTACTPEKGAHAQLHVLQHQLLESLLHLCECHFPCKSYTDCWSNFSEITTGMSAGKYNKYCCMTQTRGPKTLAACKDLIVESLI